MKKTLIALLLGLGLTAQAQTYNWTNGPIYTNLSYGSLNIPLSSNAYFSLQWQADTWNDQQQLTGTNRFKVKDMVAYTTWWTCENNLVAQWQAALQAQADAQATVRKIKQFLNSLAWTTVQLSNACVDLGLTYP